MDLILLKFVTLLAGVAAIGLLFLLDRPEDVGRLRDGWRRKGQ